jgi:DNA-binding LytR/AlgR family response regulator
MKIRIEIDKTAEEAEVIIRCARIDRIVSHIQGAVLDALAEEQRLLLLKNGMDYYLPSEDILFFEATGGKTWAHTAEDVFEIKMRLYELEEMLPRSFIRISKSAIVGARKIHSIEKNIAGPSLIRFDGSHKQVAASRRYFKILKERL